MKRTLAILMVLCMFMGCCFTASAEELLTVNYLSCWSGAAASFPSDITGNVSAQFVADNFGFVLNAADPGGNVTEVEYLNQIFAADIVPDVVNAPYWGYSQGGEGYVLINGAIEGMVKDISGYIDDYPNLKAYYEKNINASVISHLLENPEYPEGAIYFLPTGVDMGDETTVTVYGDTLYARQDVLDAVGVKAEDVTNFDELVDLLLKIKEAGITDYSGNAIIPISAMHSGWRHANIYNFSFGDNISDWRVDEDGNVSYVYMTDYLKTRIECMRTLVQNDLFDVECLSQSSEDAMAKVSQGKYAVMAIDANAAVSYYYTYLKDEHPESVLVPLGMTKSTGNNTVDVYQPGYTGGSVTFFSANISEEKLRACLSLMDYLCTPEGQAFENYGVEGVTFNYDESGKPVLTDEVAEAISADANAKTGTYGIGQFSSWCVPNEASVLWPTERSEMTEQEAAYQDMMDNFRPRVEIDKLSVDEIAAEYEGWADIQDTISTLDVGTKCAQAYFYETEEEVDALIEQIQQALIDAGIEDATAYVAEHVTDDYAF